MISLKYKSHILHIALCIFIMLCVSAHHLHAEQTYRLKGYILTYSDNAPLHGAHIKILPVQTGLITHTNGAFSIQLSAGSYTLISSYLGYNTDTSQITISKDTVINLHLRRKSYKTGAIRISKNRHDNLLSTRMGSVTLDQKTINNIPYLLGEQDPLKALQLTAGIQPAKGGETGFYVRGGKTDQNLILYNGATLYNPSHLFGIFSTFNTDALSSVSINKAGIPPYDGGRLSSVLKVNPKTGDFNEFKGEGGIGVLSSKLTLEGPLIKDSLSFILSGRRTYFDIITKPFQSFLNSSSNVFAASGYHFYDLNMNLTYKPSYKNTLLISAYQSNDAYHYMKRHTGFYTDIAWNNIAGIISWQHRFTESVSIKNSLTFTGYTFDFDAGISDYNFSLYSDIKDYTFKTDFTYILENNHVLKCGVNATLHNFQPNKQTAYTQNQDLQILDFDNIFSREVSLYVNDKIIAIPNITINFGLRYSNYAHIGPYEKYNANKVGYITDTISFKTGESLHKPYQHIEPRIAIRYLINNSTSIKASYDKAYQYVHIAPITSVTLPTDFWIPSTYAFKPQSGEQYAAGLFRKIVQYNLQTSLELYYKEMDNQIRVNNNMFGAQNKLEDRFLIGTGNSYGIEFMARKTTGKLTGWISYTLSKADRSFQEINNGNAFPAKYDRRHNISLVCSYQINDSWSFSGTFVYMSGDRRTIPTTRYLIDGSIINTYGTINGYQMPDYHRMDLSLTYQNSRKNKWNTKWNFTLYNIYNHANPFYIYFETRENINNYKLEVTPKLVSLFPILPSISWLFQF